MLSCFFARKGSRFEKINQKIHRVIIPLKCELVYNKTTESNHDGHPRRFRYYLLAIFFARSMYSLKRSSLRTGLNHSQPRGAVIP